ncbi:hypothetical protein FQR65_LT17085 [Abscondita terminalis]|nr:hypothetical protein FQR65_LT17084 [Abscondita terminalis]KAF5273743.1 hypothetical protein FQR65_LT17085 [Abscondita terminalis]
MKKLLTILGVGCLTATTLSSVIACQYVNTVNQSLTNTINSIINNTQGAFYSPILGKHEGLDAIYAKGLISSSKANEIVPQLQSDDKYANSINTYIAQKDLDNFYTELNTNDPTFLGTPIEKNPELDLINTLFSTLYGIIGSNFSVDLASTLTGLLGLGTMNDINLLPFPDFNDPDTLVETNAELN